MKALIPIKNTRDGEQLVNARSIYRFLEVGDEFRHWIKRRIADGRFEEGKDFRGFFPETPNGRPPREYAINLRMAQHICMMERTEKGEQARDYFIQCEAIAHNAVPAIPQTMAQALRLAADESEAKERLALENKLIKADLTAERGVFDIAARRLGFITLGVAADIIANPKYGKRNIFKFLAEQEMLRFIDREEQRYDIRSTHRQFFKLSPTEQNGGHAGRKYMQVRINLKGILYVIKRMQKVSGGWNALPNEQEIMDAFEIVDAKEHGNTSLVANDIHDDWAEGEY